MGITDIFRPKHRHSDAAVRAEAVRQLGPDDAELVATIARDDSDPSVRRIAIDKIENADVLAQLARAESDRGLRDRAESRAAEIWVGRAVSASAFEVGQRSLEGLLRLGDQRAIAEVASRAELTEVREAALGKLDDSKALAELARNPGTHVAARQAAIARISDLDVLRSVTIDEKRKEVALAVLDRIDDADALEVIATKAKNKTVRARARKKKLAERAKLAKAAAVDPEVQRKHAERVQLVRQASKLSQTQAWEAADAQMTQLEARWEEIGPDEDGELAERFERARARFRKRHAAYERTAARKRVEEAPVEVAEPPAEEVAEVAGESSAPAAVAGESDGEAAGDGEAEGDAASAQEALSPEEAVEQERQQQEAREREEERKQQQRERQERDLATLREVMDELDKALTLGKRRPAEKALSHADKVFGSVKLPPGSDDVVTEFQDKRQALFIKVQELREVDDWQRWANVPRQEALIENARALLVDEDQSRLSERLKKLQTEWKKVGPVPQKKSQELWTLFKQTCDQVYERVKVGRARMAEEQTVNLERKRELCEKVESLAESTEWDETAETIKQLQREWRTIGPVPRKQSDAIWKRFRGACDRFFERRQPHLDELLAERVQNLEQKQALCERAEELSESTEWQEAATALRDLQREWRDVGPVPRKDANAINKRFRGACDRFFERRQRHHDEEQAARERQIQELDREIRELVAQVRGGAAMGQVIATLLEAAPPAPPALDVAPPAEAEEDAPSAEPVEDVAEPAHDTRSLRERILGTRQALRELALTGKEAEAIFVDANELYRAAVEAAPEEFRGSELDPATSRQKKEKLLARARELAPRTSEPSPAPSEQSAEEMAARLRAALAENALSSSLAGTIDSRTLADNIAELRDAWMRIGPVPGNDGEDLEERFQSTCERALRAAGAT